MHLNSAIHNVHLVPIKNILDKTNISLFHRQSKRLQMRILHRDVLHMTLTPTIYGAA